MKKILIIFAVLCLVLNVLVPKALAIGDKNKAEGMLKTLQTANPNIANYDIKTHLVTYKDGSKPIYVTPKGEPSQNGEVSWDDFINNHGDMRGWLKLPLNAIIAEKMRF
ncbi:hypothetical protein [Caldisericum exile]|uniref:Uncharacterized protein n=1 Tax=Caldisericum exile (strain DSM 21853 / NBRC 104410 / AZM16c01) TaxID=511051 RepID=A0A7U6GD34_CALEA|nr:hypothetical protein [Caldisericum exile]BAL80190.1 hypothetical protein CSE_00640 [Caldisericum exile AZM16c01]